MDSLHSIIKSLSKSEKRYFSIYAAAFKENNELIKLFDAMDNMVPENYNDTKAAKKAGIKNIASAKSKLRKLVLKSMRSLYEDTAQHPVLRAHLTNIQFLNKKALYNEALKEIRKAEALAKEIEAYEFLVTLEIYRFLNSEKINDPDKLINTFKEYIGNVRYYSRQSEQLDISLLVKHLFVEFANMSFKSDNPKRAEYMAKLKGVLEDEGKVQSVRAKINILEAGGLYCSLTGDKNHRVKIANELLTIYEEHPQIKSNPYLGYIGVVSSQVNSYIEINDFDGAMATINLLTKAINDAESYLQSNELENNLVKTQLLYHHLQWALASKNYIYLNNKENDLQTFLTSNLPGVMPAQDVEIRLVHISLLFYLERYDMCIDYINQYLSSKHNKLILMNNFIARYIEILCYYELNKFDFAEQKANNLYKTLLEYELDAAFMKAISVFLRKLCKWNFKDAKSKNEVTQLIKDFTNLISAENHPILQITAFVSPTDWLEKKLHQ